jgi:serine/threonine-protein kinase
MAQGEKAKLRLEIGHVLFLDIVGYSTRLSDEQAEAVRDLNRIVRETEEVREAEAAGQLIRLPTGDGMALVFTSSVEAPVECALQIDRALRGQPGLRVRMGIHSGPVRQVEDVNQRSNVAGAGINIAQRVMDCGDAGHILLSQRVAEDLSQLRQWRPCLHELGECEVKHDLTVSIVNLYTTGVGNPELPQKFAAAPQTAPLTGSTRKRRALTSLGAIAGGLLLVAILTAIFGPSILRWPGFKPTKVRPLSATDKKSIAVLPFENLSDDKANAYFASGIQDEILAKLAAIRDLKVISRTSTEKYRSHPDDLRKVAQELDVAVILEGSVQKAKDRAHINVQLIDARTDAHLWAQTYDRELTDIFSVEGEVADQIAAALKLRLMSSTNNPPTVSTADPEAYDLFLRALYEQANWYRGLGNVDESLRLLRAAIAHDPKFARAYAYLSVYESQKIAENLSPDEELARDARLNAEKALTLDPGLPAALAAMGLLYLRVEHDYTKALDYLEQAHEKEPGFHPYLIPLAIAQAAVGRWNEALETIQGAVTLSPGSSHTLEVLGSFAAKTHQYSRAHDAYDRALILDPNNWSSVAEKAELFLAQGKLSEALDLLAKLPAEINFSTLEVRWKTAFLSRDYVGALKIARNATGTENGEQELLIGTSLLALGDRTAAAQSLEQARSQTAALLTTYPESPDLHQGAAKIFAARGDKINAVAEAERAIALLPLGKNADGGLYPLETLAEVHAMLSAPDKAVPLLQQLLTTNGAGLLLTPALLRLDPVWDPIRGDSRFQELIRGD